MQKITIRKNFIYSTLYQALLMITPLLTAPYISRVLDARTIGIYSYTNSLATYFTMVAALGVLSYGNREISRYRDNKETISRLFWEIEALVIITTTATLFLWFIIIIFYQQYRIYLLLLSMQIVGVIFDISWFFGGLELYGYIVKKNAVCKIAGIILLFVLVKDADDLWLYILITVSSAVIGNISMWLYLPKLIDKIGYKSLKIKRHFKQTIIYFIPTIATSIYTVLDKTLIGIITQNEYENGYYEQATKIINMAKMLTFTALNTVMGSRISYLFAQNKFEQIHSKIEKSLDYILLVGLGISFGIIGITNRFVPWFFGDGYDNVIYLLYLLSPIIVIIGISNCAGSLYYTPAGLRAKSTIFIIIGSCSNLLLNILLIPKYGSYGAVISSLFAETIITVLYVHFSKGYFSFFMIIKMSWKRLISGMTMLMVILQIGSKINSSIILTGFQVVTGSVVYLFFLIVLKDKFMVTILMELRKKLGIALKKK